ncbi:hypothetical protein AVEN_139710-1, partial [Araneus ventricosus]
MDALIFLQALIVFETIGLKVDEFVKNISWQRYDKLQTRLAKTPALGTTPFISTNFEEFEACQATRNGNKALTLLGLSVKRSVFEF